MPDDILPAGFVAASAIMKLLYISLAVVVWWGLLRFLDIIGKLQFKQDVIPLLKSNAIAAAIYFGARALAAALIVTQLALAGLFVGGVGLLVMLSPKAEAASLQDGSFDAAMQSAAGRYWLDYPDWRMLKAQLWQESHFDVAAVSPVGARGIAQFMPATWREVTHALGRPGADVHDAEIAIDAAAYYMLKLRRAWKGRDRSPMARQDLALASYNAGMGSILKAQRRCGDALLWVHIAPCLPQVTGVRNAHETTTYVSNIAKWRAKLGSRT